MGETLTGCRLLTQISAAPNVEQAELSTQTVSTKKVLLLYLPSELQRTDVPISLFPHYSGLFYLQTTRRLLGVTVPGIP